MRKIFFLIALGLVSQRGYSANVGSPQSVQIKFYELWVSPNSDCTSLTQVYSDSNPSYQNVVTGPTFGSITLTNGTYQCIAMKISDVVKLTPDYNSDWGHCQLGVEITRDLFRAGAGTSTCPDSTVLTGSGSLASPVEDGMCVYLSTTGNETTNSSMEASQPGLLNSPFVVAGTTVGTAVFDFTNGIEDTAAGGGGSCSPETVQFSFR